MSVVKRNEIAAVELTALTANTGKAVSWEEGDEKLVLVVQNAGSSSTTLTIKAGNGIQGVADKIVAVPVGINLLKLESGRFKNVSGDNKGKIVVVSPGTVKVGIAALE